MLIGTKWENRYVTMTEKTYYDWLFEKTEEEKKINKELDEEMSRFENSEAYYEHRTKVDEILLKLKDAKMKRREEAKKHKPSRKAYKRMSEEEMKEFREQNEKKKEARISTYPEALRNLIKEYEALDNVARKVFRNETWIYEPDYDDFKDPVTTEKDMKELLEILVQTTIDFINERGLTDIFSVGFSADDLQVSAKSGEWTPATDASIHVTGLGKEKSADGTEYTVVQKIGSYM